MDNKSWSGRPQILSRWEKRTIVPAAKRDRAMTRLEMRNWYVPHVSIRTINCVLGEAHMNKWLAQRNLRPRLDARHANARLEWALGRKDWTAEDFQGILYPLERWNNEIQCRQEIAQLTGCESRDSDY